MPSGTAILCKQNNKCHLKKLKIRLGRQTFTFVFKLDGRILVDSLVEIPLAEKNRINKARLILYYLAIKSAHLSVITGVEAEWLTND